VIVGVRTVSDRRDMFLLLLLLLVLLLAVVVQFLRDGVRRIGERRSRRRGRREFVEGEIIRRRLNGEKTIEEVTDGQREKMHRNRLKVLTKDMFSTATENLADRDFLQRRSSR
jgi:hypothetical protein